MESNTNVQDNNPESRAIIPNIIPLEEYFQHRLDSNIILPEDQALMNNVSDNPWLNNFAKKNLEALTRDLDSDDKEILEGLLDLSKEYEDKKKLSEAINSVNAQLAVQNTSNNIQNKKYNKTQGFKSRKQSKKFKPVKKSNNIFKPSDETIRNFQMPSSKQEGGYLIENKEKRNAFRTNKKSRKKYKYKGGVDDGNASPITDTESPSQPVLPEPTLDEIFLAITLHSDRNTTGRNIFRDLWKRNGDWLSTDSQGNNVIHQAVLFDRSILAKMLIKRFEKDNNHKQMLSLQNNNGNTPLHVATNTMVLDGYGLNAFNKMGIEENINLQNNDGNTVLHMISNAQFESLDDIKKTINNLTKIPGIKINLQNNNGDTPLVKTLLRAASHGDDYEVGISKVIIETLLNNGANVDLKNNNQESAISIALKYRYHDILGLLYNHLAKRQTKRTLVEQMAHPSGARGRIPRGSTDYSINTNAMNKIKSYLGGNKTRNLLKYKIKESVFS